MVTSNGFMFCLLNNILFKKKYIYLDFALQHILLPPAGIEPAIFRLEVGRLSRLATGAIV